METVGRWMRFLKIPELVPPPSSLAPQTPKVGTWGEISKYSVGTWSFGLVWVWNQQHQFYKETNIFHCKINTQTSTVNVNGLLSMQLDQKHPLSSTFSEVK